MSSITSVPFQHVIAAELFGFSTFGELRIRSKDAHANITQYSLAHGHLVATEEVL